MATTSAVKSPATSASALGRNRPTSPDRAGAVAADQGSLASTLPAAVLLFSATGRAISNAQASGNAITVQDFLAQRKTITNAVISDTSVNIARYFSTLRAGVDKITSVSVTDAGTPLRLKANQYLGADDPLVSKLNVDYSVALSDVTMARVSSLVNDAHVVSMAISDSSAEIARAIDQLGSLGGTLTGIEQKGAKKPLEISMASFKNADNLAALGKIKGTYNLSIKDVPIANAGDITALNDLLANTKVTSVSVKAAASDVKTNLTLLAAANKIKTIRPESGPETISFSPAEFSEKFNKKLSGFDLAVRFNGQAIQYSIDTDSRGARTVSKLPNRTETYKFSNNVNFFQFTDKNLFGTTGDARVDAILMGGEQYWWSNPDPDPNSITDIPGASRSSAAVPLMNQVGTLDSTSSRLSPLTIKVGFLGADIGGYANAGSKDANGYAPMTVDQQNGVLRALDYISSLVNLTFEKVTNLADADIRFGTNDQGTASGAYAYPPNSVQHLNVMMNNNGDPSSPSSIESTNNNLAQGSYGWMTLIHEIGHALGLKHPGNYNAGGGGTPGPYLPAGDAGSRRFSIMSYTDIKDGKNVTQVGNLYSTGSLTPATFMPYDLVALQFLYGVNLKGEVNNVVDGVKGALSGNVTDVNNFQKLAFTSDWRGFQTIYAPTAIDNVTLDLSSVANKNIIDLRPGAYSSVNVLPATTQSNLPAAVRSYQTYLGFNNVALSYGSQIDKVLGGAGGDTYYVGGQNIEIRDNAGVNTVNLPGLATEWSVSAYSNGPDTGKKFTRGSQEVILVGGDLTNADTWAATWKINYYDPAKLALLHSKVNLTV